MPFVNFCAFCVLVLWIRCWRFHHDRRNVLLAYELIERRHISAHDSRQLLQLAIDLRNDLTMYFVVLAIFLFGFLLIYRVIHSPFGQVLKSIRENEARAISLGYDSVRYKFMAFVLSGTLAGLAGATKALVFQLASLTDVHWTMSGEVVLMTLLGGLGTIFGPVVGALIIITMENYLAPFGAWVTIVQGVIFVICVLTFRRGVIGEIANFLKKPL